jgi:dolichyl-diphosphooligosaccharide--protein glycosyltransferase
MTRWSRFKRSAGRFLRQVFHKPKAKISRGSILIFLAMVLIFFAALIIRINPLLDAQPVVRAFDPWFQLKATEYIVENGYAAFFSWYDDATWVPWGRDMPTTTYIGVPFTSTFLYFAANSLGISVDFVFVSLVLPALMGSLTVIVSFFLGRELYNNTVGLLSALFMAFIPAFIQRTIAGFYDNECIGVFAITLTMFFFIRSLKNGSPSYAIAAGISLAYLLGSWGAGDYLVALLALYAFAMLLFGRYNTRLLVSYLPTITLGLFLSFLVPRNGFKGLTSFTNLAAIGVAGLLVTYEIWTRLQSYREATAAAMAPHVKPLLLGLVTSVTGAIAYFLYASSNELSITIYNSNPIVLLGRKFLSVINPFFRLDQRIFASVAEHLPSPWSSFYNTLYMLIFFFPLGLYFLFKRGRDEDWLLVLYGVTTVYFTGSMIRLSLILALGVSLLAAVAVNGILAPFSKIVTQQSVFERRRFRMSSSLTSEHAIAAYVFVGLLLSINILLGVSYTTKQVGNPEFAPFPISKGAGRTDWQTTMSYIKNVLPATSIIASWWDYGYWINTAGGAQTIVDNATVNSTQIALMGYALMSLNLTESLRTFKIWNTTHVLVYWGHRHPGFGGDDGKWPWMVRIAEDHLGSHVINDETYLGDNPDTSETVETDYTLDAFFSSTLYKLMMAGESKDQANAQELGLSNEKQSLDSIYWDDTRWTSYMPVDLHGAFKKAFWSFEYGTVKLYEIDYTMYEQSVNMSSADWVLEKDVLDDVVLDGTLTAEEKDFRGFDVVFGGGYEATVYTHANDTHVYLGVAMDNYTLSDDAFGLQVAPMESTRNPDVRVVNYEGHNAWDGYIDYKREWVADSIGVDESEFATGEKVIEFILPLESSDSDDLPMFSGMNYQLRFLWWNNVNRGEPTFSSDWATIWIPVDLY